MNDSAPGALSATFPAPDAVPGAVPPCPWPLKIATWNVHGAVGTDGRFEPGRIRDVLGELDADVIALQEMPLGGAWRPNLLDALREATGYHAAEGATIDTPERRYGNAVLSRFPIRATRAIDLSFGQREPRGALDTDLVCHEHPIRVVATHLGLRPAERREQIARLLKAFDTDAMPVVLMGDINEWFVWGRPLRRLVSHFQAAPAPPTFPSRRPVLSLDRIWVRPRRRMLSVRVHASALARVASDHLPLVATLGE